MKLFKIKFTYLLILVLTIVFFSFDMPIGWHKTSSTNLKSYDMGIDKGAGIDGKNAATIKSIKKKPKGFGAMVQNCLADNYIG